MVSCAGSPAEGYPQAGCAFPDQVPWRPQLNTWRPGGSNFSNAGLASLSIGDFLLMWIAFCPSQLSKLSRTSHENLWLP